MCDNANRRGAGSETPTQRSANLMETWPARLPRLELLIYTAVWLSHSLYACYAVWLASEAFGRKTWSGNFEPGWSLLGSPRKDISNFEWTIWSAHILRELPWYVGHLLLFNFGHRLVGVANMHWHPLMLLYWLLASSVYFVGIGGIAIAAVQALLVLLVAQLSRKSLVWLVAIALLAGLIHGIEFDERDIRLFRVLKLANGSALYETLVFFAYKALQLISFAIADIDRRSEGAAGVRSFWRRYYDLLWYSFYMPYNCTLIVVYGDFCRQLDARASHRLHLHFRCVLSLAARVLLWSLFNDFVLQVSFFNALMIDGFTLRSVSHVNLAWLGSIGYIAGQFFHSKYMSIFGVPTVVATIDRMQPPWPPVCISRVALYAKMWRFFDRGLYGFLRELIYLPVLAFVGRSPAGVRPTTATAVLATMLKRALATGCCFAFVWFWHGASLACFIWVSLNFVEVMLENVAKQLYEEWPLLNRLLAHLFSTRPRAFRRFIACLHVPCVALGIVGIFYFIGGKESGDVFVHRFIIDNALRMRLPWLHLLVLGYCFAQTCIEIDRRWPTRPKMTLTVNDLERDGGYCCCTGKHPGRVRDAVPPNVFDSADGDASDGSTSTGRKEHFQ